MRISFTFDTVSEAISEVLVGFDVKSILTEMRYITISSKAYCGYQRNKTEDRLVCKTYANVTNTPAFYLIVLKKFAVLYCHKNKFVVKASATGLFTWQVEVQRKLESLASNVLLT